MTFFLDIAWWFIVAAATAATSALALMKPSKPLLILAAVVAWTVSVAWTGMLLGALAALAAAAFSLVWGVILFLLTLLLSGVRMMAKKRYG
ncbi:MAG: hypothetical protein HGA70_05265 [Chlorobiaceae bacterium]|nr:hypothetical protein [Chlorobiaceae bacterium]